MKSTLSLTRALVAGIALAFLATAAYAATTTGVVVSTDDSTNVVTIRTEDGRQLSFLKNDATTFDPAGTAASFADLEPGDRITVTSDLAPSDPAVQLTATQLRIDAPIAVAANDTTGDSEMETASRLPSTATPLPLVALAAVGSILAGIGLRLRRR
jgi:hypothetical protein